MLRHFHVSRADYMSLTSTGSHDLLLQHNIPRFSFYDEDGGKVLRKKLRSLRRNRCASRPPLLAQACREHPTTQTT